MKGTSMILSVAVACASAYNHGPYNPNSNGNHGYQPEPYPAYPVYPINPQPNPVAPIAPTVTVTTVSPAPTKLPTTMSCKKWNRMANDGDCDYVANKKCTTKPSKKSKYEECSEDTCCTTETTTVAEVAPAPTQATTATVISCAQYCGQNSLQCQVVVQGACALEGPFGQYNQCSKELCCGSPAPPSPQPQIVSCKQVVAGNGWSCGMVPDYGCSVTGPSGKYPACTYDACCLMPIPPSPVDPCDYCDKYWCPPQCENHKPIDLCKYCNLLMWSYCPDFCRGSNDGYNKVY
jgi:hypothetical protein